MTVDFWSKLFTPTPRQVTFLQATRDARYLLYGGARGGGKSALLRWGLVWQLLEWAKQGHDNVRVGLFCEDYPTLKDRQISKIRKEMPGWLGELKATQDEGHGFYLRPEYGGGAILLRNLDDVAKYQSAEFAAVAVEELTKNTIDVFNILRGSLRWPGIGHTQFWGATNPGGQGHLWVKALWIDRDFSGEYSYLAERAEEFRFVKSLPIDNPHLDDAYWEELNSLPEGLRKAWVEGDWDVFEGQAFGEWSREAHVASYQPERGQDGVWTCAGDWGYEAQGVCYLIWTGPERSLVRREFTFRKKEPYTAGFEWGQILKQFPRPDWMSLDAPSVSDGGPTIREEFQRGLKAACGPNTPPVIAPPKGKGSRHTKKQLMHEHLRYARKPDGTISPWAMPKLQFHESCRYIIRTLPALPLDEKDSEDVDSEADDHGYDAIADWLTCRVPKVARDDMKGPAENAHPGLSKSGVRRNRQEPEPVGGGRFQRYRPGAASGEYE